jgi:uncharacterized membrane protein YdjX (TVP38/TMEM64 family)
VRTSSGWRLAVAGGILLGAILIPFAAFGNQLETWAAALIELSSTHAGAVFAVVVLLLMLDVALPIPSSLVSTTGGILLGFTGGLAASSLGLTLGAVIAYGVGRYSAGAARRLVGSDDTQRLCSAFNRHGDWLIVVSRSVPVLAESAPVVAGVARMPFGRFVASAGLASVGVAAAYSLLGASAGSATSFLLVFGGAVLVPLGPMLWLRRTRRVSRTSRSGARD